MTVRFRTGLGLCAAVLALTAAAGGLFRTPAEAAETVRAPLGDYVLRDCGGCVAVYRPWDDSRPEQVTDIEVCLLPRADRVQLGQGIGARDREALVRLLEDLNS